MFTDVTNAAVSADRVIESDVKFRSPMNSFMSSEIRSGLIQRTKGRLIDLI